jgi:hypothetical protein
MAKSRRFIPESTRPGKERAKIRLAVHLAGAAEFCPKTTKMVALDTCYGPVCAGLKIADRQCRAI